MTGAAAAHAQRNGAGGKKRMRGPQLAILVKRANGVPVVEGVARAGEDRVIASSKRLDKALVGSYEWISIKDVFACWSGTMTAYKEPGEKLGDFGLFDGLLFPINKEYRNERNAIQVVEHPDYTTKQCTRDVIEWVQDVYGILLPKNLTEKNSVVVVHDLGMVDLVANFPASDGWYPVDEKHGIPIVGSSLDRYLLRVDSRVGPVARVDDVCDSGRYVVLDGGPSFSLGMAVEAPADAPEELRLNKKTGN